jgi:hypothetical protein
MIEHKTWIEGPDGKAVMHYGYEREKVRNPYAPKKETSRQKRNRAARATMAQRVAPPSKGYRWSMGYNQCVGRYSIDGKSQKFSGSSYNRCKQLKLYEGETDIPTDPGDYFKMALKAAEKYRRRRLPVPSEISNYIVLRDSESERKFRLWLSASEGRPVVSLPVYIHELSPRSRGKVKDKATAFFRASAGDRVFLTLTFVAAVDDQTGCAILNKFLTSVRKAFGKQQIQYLWVAERQENGNIHFHCIINKRLPVRRWNGLWVLAQYNAGLRSKDKYGDEITMEEIRERFEKGTVGKVLNPLDVRKIKSISALSNYLTKYITKQKKNIGFACAPWHCSRRVSRMFTRATVGPSAFAYMCSPANWRVDRRTGECWPPKIDTSNQFWMIVYAAEKSAPLKYLKTMELANKWTLEGHVLDWLPEISDDAYRIVFGKN